MIIDLPFDLIWFCSLIVDCFPPVYNYMINFNSLIPFDAITLNTKNIREWIFIRAERLL